MRLGSTGGVLKGDEFLGSGLARCPGGHRQHPPCCTRPAGTLSRRANDFCSHRELFSLKAARILGCGAAVMRGFAFSPPRTKGQVCGVPSTRSTGGFLWEIRAILRAPCGAAWAPRPLSLFPFCLLTLCPFPFLPLPVASHHPTPSLDPLGDRRGHRPEQVPWQHPRGNPTHPEPPGSPPGEDRVRASRWMCFALAANAFLLPRSSRNPKRGPVHPRDAGCVPWRGTGRVPWGASPLPSPPRPSPSWWG